MEMKAEDFDQSCFQCKLGMHFCPHCGRRVSHTAKECITCRPISEAISAMETILDAHIIRGEN